MRQLRDRLPALLRPDARADRLVPRTGIASHLALLVAGVMAFLAVFALALSVASGRLATRWAEELGGGATIRIPAASDREDAQVTAVLRLLRTTPGVAEAHLLTDEEQDALLAPWFGAGLDLSSLPVPHLIEVIETADGLDTEGLRSRLAAEAPEAVLDDHSRWREPLVGAARRLRLLGWLSIGLILAATTAMITLAAHAALAANAQVVTVLRTVGATDAYIADAFVRRFTWRAGLGAGVGTAAGLVCILLVPSSGGSSGLLAELGFAGWQWLVPLLVPPLAVGVAYVTTRISAARVLQGHG